MTIQRLHGAQFEVAQVDVDSVFKTVSSSKMEKVFWLGPGIIHLILQAQQHSIQSIASLTRSLQVCKRIKSKSLQLIIASMHI